jgi:hypothetical protein
MIENILKQILDIENSVSNYTNLEFNIKIIEIQQQVIDSWYTFSPVQRDLLTDKIFDLKTQIFNKKK